VLTNHVVGVEVPVQGVSIARNRFFQCQVAARLDWTASAKFDHNHVSSIGALLADGTPYSTVVPYGCKLNGCLYAAVGAGNTFKGATAGFKPSTIYAVFLGPYTVAAGVQESLYNTIEGNIVHGIRSIGVETGSSDFNVWSNNQHVSATLTAAILVGKSSVQTPPA
jgi:hypothetical protein